MKLILYSIDDDSNVINKTLGVGLEIDIEIRAQDDISNVVLMLAKINGVDFKKFNYCFIDGFDRFYFIDSISNVNGLLWKLNLSCDVLETYKADILASKARLKRNLKTGDYVDGQIDMTVNKSVMVYKSDKGFTGDKTIILTTLGV